MPFMFGNQPSHDGSQHIGSAARDAANGVAGLDSGGVLLVPGNTIMPARNGNNDVFLKERTASEDIAFFRRVAANDFDMFVKESNVARQVQTASMKDVASGIIGLDANLLMGAAGMAAFNLLKIVNTNWVTVTLTGTGAAAANNAAGTLQVSTPANGDDSEVRETDKIALSLLPRIGVFRVNSVTMSGATAQAMFGFWSANATTHYAVVDTVNGGAGWNFRTNDGVASEVTAIATVAAGDVFVMYLTSARCSLWKNGAHVVTHVTRRPTDPIGHQLSIVNGVGEGAGNEITLGFMS